MQPNPSLRVWKLEENRFVEKARKKAYQAYQEPILQLRAEAMTVLEALSKASPHEAEVRQAVEAMATAADPLRRDVANALHTALVSTRGESSAARDHVVSFARRLENESQHGYPVTFIPNLKNLRFFYNKCLRHIRRLHPP